MILGFRGLIRTPHLQSPRASRCRTQVVGICIRFGDYKDRASGVTLSFWNCWETRCQGGRLGGEMGPGSFVRHTNYVHGIKLFLDEHSLLS